jgi:hypothetical protein
MVHGPLFTPSGGSVSTISGANDTRRVTYTTGLTISFVHTQSSKEVGSNDAGSYRIGNIGGANGETPGYVHTHIVFFSDFKNRVRVDPRKVFCGW